MYRELTRFYSELLEDCLSNFLSTGYTFHSNFRLALQIEVVHLTGNTTDGSGQLMVFQFGLGLGLEPPCTV